ncbi:MAG: hypothetical protein WEA09_12490 [Gemmatimonadota bacterium]
MVNGLKRLVLRVIHAAPRLFPLSLIFTVMSALIRARTLRRHRYLAAIAEAKTEASPTGALLWLDRVTADRSRRSPYPFDACLLLPGQGRASHLHEVFSVLLASPRVESVAFYWDEAALADDLPLWMPRADRLDPAADERGEVDAPSQAEIRAFVQRGHHPVTLPPPALREAETLLKRLVGSDLAVCVNLPPSAGWLAGPLAAEFPLVHFFQLSPADGEAPDPPTNLVPIHTWGFSLHERMALARGTDAYLGHLDVLAAMAVMAGRPTALIAEPGEEDGPPEADGERVLWVPAETSALVKALHGFVDRHSRRISESGH